MTRSTDPAVSELNALLAHSPVLLTSLLSITLARNWLAASVYVMQLHARLVQAVKPSRVPANDYLQYPSIRPDEVRALSIAVKKYKTGPDVDTLEAVVKKMKADEDPRASIVAKAGQRWCRLDVVDASFTGTKSLSVFRSLHTDNNSHSNWRQDHHTWRVCQPGSQTPRCSSHFNDLGRREKQE